MKIAIIGYSGSGKSTLAKNLAEIYRADILPFDTVNFLPDWQTRDKAEQKRITKEFLDTHESWVIDGNYTNLLYERRMTEADVIRNQRQLDAYRKGVAHQAASPYIEQNNIASARKPQNQ